MLVIDGQIIAGEQLGVAQCRPFLRAEPRAVAGHAGDVLLGNGVGLARQLAGLTGGDAGDPQAHQFAQTLRQQAFAVQVFHQFQPSQSGRRTMRPDLDRSNRAEHAAALSTLDRVLQRGRHVTEGNQRQAGHLNRAVR
ncbi:hypothetical protein D3C79_854160 [compost metagenome]